MRDGQFWLIPVDGGEPRALTKHATSPSAPQWSPDGTAVYFIAADPPSADDRERTRLRDDVYAADETYRQRQLWKIVVSTGAETQLTNGESTVKSYSLSANGKRMVVQRAPTPADMDAYRGEVWVMDANGENAARPDQQRDRREVARHLARRHAGAVHRRHQRAASSSTTRRTCSSCPRPAARRGWRRRISRIRSIEAVWAPDGKTILATVNMGVHSEFFRVDVAVAARASS